MRYHYTPIKMTRIQNTDNNKCFWRCGATGAPTHCWWERKMVQLLWTTVWWLLTKLSILLPWVSMSVLVAQSCPTCCNPMDCSLLGSSVHRILQARILGWVAIPFFRRSSWPRDWIQVSCIPGRFFTLWATREAQLLPYNQANELKTMFKTCT